MEDLQAKGKLTCLNSKLDFVQPLVTNVNISRGNRNWRPGELSQFSQHQPTHKDKYAIDLPAEISQQDQCSLSSNNSNHSNTDITQDLVQIIRQQAADSRDQTTMPSQPQTDRSQTESQTSASESQPNISETEPLNHIQTNIQTSNRQSKDISAQLVHDDCLPADQGEIVKS